MELCGAAWNCLAYAGLRKKAQDYVACYPLRFTGKRGLGQTGTDWDAGWDADWDGLGQTGTRAAVNCRKLAQTGASCRKLAQTAANWRKLPQTGVNWRKLAQVGASCITPIKL